MLILFQGFASQGIALADGEEEERAVAIARRYESIGDILGRYGDSLAAEARYLDQWGVWRVGFSLEGSEVAWAAVSLEENRVLEFAAADSGSEQAGPSATRSDWGASERGAAASRS